MRRHTGQRTYERVAARLPPNVAARADHLMPERLVSGWEGAVNGQLRRLDAVTEIITEISFEAVVETGTYRGATTALLRRLSQLQVETVEIHPRYFEYA